MFRTWLKDLPSGVTERDFLERTNELQKQYLPSIRLLPGVAELVTHISHTPNVHLAIASSSSSASFSLKTKHLSKFMSSFPPGNIILGDDPRLPAGTAKPAPEIYHLALQTVNRSLEKATLQRDSPIQSRECLVFEDSVSGVQAGLAAGMRVLWCPHIELYDQYFAARPFAGAERVTLVRSLEKFEPEELDDFHSGRWLDAIGH